MLGLMAPTRGDWLAVAESNLEELMQDHAQCELKAAHTALSLVGRFGAQHPQMVEPLTALAREEASHFGMVAAELGQRGQSLGYPVSDDYVTSLVQASRQSRRGQPQLLDRLLVGALVEGRSCERFRILADGLKDASLARFYRGLMASEAKHFTLFVGLADSCHGKQAARERFEQLAAQEATIIESGAPQPAVHG